MLPSWLLEEKNLKSMQAGLEHGCCQTVSLHFCMCSDARDPEVSALMGVTGSFKFSPLTKRDSQVCVIRLYLTVSLLNGLF